MPPLKPGDQVKGKTKLLQRKRGIITESITEGTKKKLRVEWSDSTSDVVFARSLEKIPDVGAPGPLIGPTLGANLLSTPHREDNFYEDEGEDSESDVDSERDRDHGEDNEIPPEDGLIESPNNQPIRCVFSVF
jgi:hypothetical protein